MRTQRSVLSIVLIAWSVLASMTIFVEAASLKTRAVCDQCEETDRFVRLQQTTEDSHSTHLGPLTHPLVLSPEEWASILRGLQVQRQAEGLLFRDPPGPVLSAFAPEEIEYLSATLSKAFAQAQPHEWVVFGLSQLNAYHMPEITTGGWFADGSSLHLVLANYRKAATMPSTRQLLWERPLRPDAGPAYDLVASTHQTSVRPSRVNSGLFSSAPSELSIAYSAILLGEPVEAASPPASSVPPSGSASPSMSLEERLRVLKRLNDQGLITEDDYRAKKQQLLERF